jgi:hypothetical protein
MTRKPGPRVRLSDDGAAGLAIRAFAYAAALFALLAATPAVPLHDGFDYDGRFYAAMAGDPRLDPDLARVEPFCYRVLTPWLAARLPGPMRERFVALDFASWLGTALLLHALARRLGADAKAAYLAVGLLLATFAGPRFAFYSPYYTEPLMMCLIAFGLLCVERGWFAALVLLVPLAILQRPQTLVLAACSAVADWQARRFTAARLAGYGLMLGAALEVRRAVGRSVEPLNHYAELFAVREIALRLAEDPEFRLRSALGAGIGLGVAAVAVAALPGARRLLLERRHLLAYLLLGLLSLLGGYDKMRPVFILAPAWALALAVGFARLGLGGRAFAAMALGLSAAHLLTQAPWTDLADGEAYLNALVPEAAPDPDAKGIALRLAAGNALALATLVLARRFGAGGRGSPGIAQPQQRVAPVRGAV